MPVLLMLVAIVVILVHQPALTARALTFDDSQYLLENRLVKSPSLASAKTFLSEVWAPSTVAGYYQPLAMISLMLDTAMGGSPENLRPYHRTSLALHTLNTLLIVILLWRIFGNIWIAAIVGLLFGVHPLSVEPIPWIGERKTVLATFFALASLVTYVHHARRPSWLRLIAPLVLYVLALMAKPTTTGLPLAMLLMDYWPLRRIESPFRNPRALGRVLIEKIPFVAIMILSMWITYVSQKTTSGVADPGKGRSLEQILLILTHNVAFYPYKMLWPIYLSPHYNFPLPYSFAHPAYRNGLIVTALVGGGLLVSLYWTRALAIGWLIWLILIAPALGVIGFNNVIASDKYTYLPVVGFLMLLAWPLVEVWKRVQGSARAKVMFAGAAVLLGGIVSAEAAVTRNYLQKWQQTETLYRHMLIRAPLAPSLHNDLAVDLVAQGRVPEALAHYQVAVDNSDKNLIYQCTVRNNYGIALAQSGRIDEAIEQFKPVVAIWGPLADRTKEIANQAASARFNLGNCFTKKNRLPEAAEQYREVVRLDPFDPNARFMYGQVLAGMGQSKEAIVQLRETLRLAPDYSLALELLRQMDPSAR